MNGEKNAQRPAAPRQPQRSTAERLKEGMPSMRTAVMWAEILDKPLSHRGRR